MSGAINTEGARQVTYAEAFRLRMESQCHEIERYRLTQMRTEGRELSIDEAAREWIERFAAEFADDYSSGSASNDTCNYGVKYV